MSALPWPVWLIAPPLLLVMGSMAIVMAHQTYRLLVGPRVPWSALEVRYPHTGNEPANTKSSFIATRAWRPAFSTHVGTDAEGMHIYQHNAFSPHKALKIPWQHLALDLDAGLLITVKIVPEGAGFTFHRWFLGKAALERLKA